VTAQHLAAVLAVDGGNSKADLALIAADGTLLAFVRGPTISHQAVGLDEGMRRLAGLASQARERLDPASPPSSGLAVGQPQIAVLGLAGADYPADVRRLGRAIERLDLARETVVLNDTFAALRAGSRRPWGVVLICGQGSNAAAVAPDGRSARFAGVGDISGDWGGGTSLGQAGLGAAVRGRDGRGPRTALERTVPAFYGLRTPEAVTRAFYDGRLEERRIGELAPTVFATAGDGDGVARSIVDHLADELAVMATALIRRLRLARLDVEVVLAGGVFRTEDGPFHDRLTDGIRAVAPGARLVRLTTPPVLGAGLLGLDRLAGGAAAGVTERRLRADFASVSGQRSTS
jgi:N-acetylglucosamine kinase-like BadF-type ATPase